MTPGRSRKPRSSRAAATARVPRWHRTRRRSAPWSAPRTKPLPPRVHASGRDRARPPPKDRRSAANVKNANTGYGVREPAVIEQRIARQVHERGESGKARVLRECRDQPSQHESGRDGGAPPRRAAMRRAHAASREHRRAE